MNNTTRILLLVLICSTLAPMSLQAQDAEPQPQPFDYVMLEIRMTGRSKNPLQVVADFGQTYGQRAESLRYSRALSEFGTRGAVLNYMAERGFELVEAMVEPRISFINHSSESPVFYFIMKRAKESSDG